MKSFFFFFLRKIVKIERRKYISMQTQKFSSKSISSWIRLLWSIVPQMTTSSKIKKKKIPSIVPFLLYRCAQTCYSFLQPRGTMFPWFFHPGTMTRLAQLSAKALFLVIVGDGNVRLGWKKLSTVIVFYLTLGGLFHFRSFRN